MVRYGTKQFRETGLLLEYAKRLAVQYKSLTLKPLGITSELAEYEVAKKLKCTLCNARTAGHDLIDCEGNKVQVKGRVIPDKKSHRVPSINKSSTGRHWDYVVLVLFDANYDVLGFYKASERTIEKHFAKPRPKGGKQRRNISVSEFKKIATQI